MSTPSTIRRAAACHGLRLASAVLLAAVSACASMPGPGETVTMAVNGVIGERDIATRRDVAAARPALQAAGIGAAELAAGRVLRVQCAVMSDGWWDSLAIVPPDFGPVDDRAVLVEVVDRGTNDRLPINRVIAHAEPRLGPGGPAYRVIPDWRERGLRRNFEEQPPAGGPRSAYTIVQGSWVVDCRR